MLTVWKNEKTEEGISGSLSKLDVQSKCQKKMYKLI